MGVLDKLRRVLFDEDEVEVEVNNDELPTKPSKKPAKQHGFKDYHQEEEDTIKEVVLPKEDPVEEPVVEEVTKEIPPVRETFPVDNNYGETIDREDYGLRSHRYTEPVPEPVQEEFKPAPPQAPVQHKEEPSSLSPEEFNKKYRVEPLKPKNHEEKDYHSYLSDDKVKTGKKPFKVTPVISPVYGILDENFKPSEVVNKADFNPSQREGRKKKEEKKTTLKEDLVELNTTINEIINESVEEPKEEEKVPEVKETKPKKAEPKVEEKVVQEVEVVAPEVEIEIEEPTPEVVEEPVIDSEPEMDIEDAFEPTDELSTINEEEETPEEEDLPVEEAEPTISLDELIKANAETEEDEDEEEGLNNTIETDLYNLINSMYKDDDEEEE